MFGRNKRIVELESRVAELERLAKLQLTLDIDSKSTHRFGGRMTYHESYLKRHGLYAEDATSTLPVLKHLNASNTFEPLESFETQFPHYTRLKRLQNWALGRNS